MKRADNKSRCPINFSVEIFGDTWSMLIVRDMAALGKKTFSEFLDSSERIGPSVLAERLVHLEKKGIISKTPDAKDKRKTIYTLTEDGLDAIPILLELAIWGWYHSPNAQAPPGFSDAIEKFDKKTLVSSWCDAIRAGDSFFVGPNCAAARLGLYDSTLSIKA
jgi:DNA-binding HxlR family transcriptional regulator